MLGIRPEAFEDAAFASPDLPALEARVEVLEELGSDAHVFFPIDARRILAEANGPEDDVTALAVGSEALLNARLDPRTDARVGQSIRLAVDPRRFHFFDPDSGASLLDATQTALAPHAAAVGSSGTDH